MLFTGGRPDYVRDDEKCLFCRTLFQYHNDFFLHVKFKLLQHVLSIEY